MKPRFALILVSLLGLFSLGLFGCDDSGDNNSNSTSLLRVFNGLIGTPVTGIDVYARNSVKLNPTPLNFKGKYPISQITVNNQLSFYGAITSGTGIDFTVFP